MERSVNLPRFVDSHVHYYDMQHPELVYSHWGPDVVHPTLGTRVRALGERNFLAEDFIDLTRPFNVAKAVHVQAAIGSPDPVTETAWLQEAADRTGFPHGIIAAADLSSADAEATLQRHCRYANMRGVRDFEAAGRLDDPATLRGFALLEEMGLIASMNVTWEHMARVRSIAERHPELQLVIDHTGSPRGRTREYVADWRRGMATAAGAGNVWCKLSGLGMTDHEWSTDSIRPFIEYCIETFGVERCFFGTNWPVDSLFSSYETVVAAYAEITAGLSEGERTALHAGNAERLYRI